MAPRRHAEDAPGEPAQTSLLPEPDAPAFALPEPLYAQDGTVFLQELPAALLTPLRAMQAPLQAWLEDNPESDAHPQMLELYFAVQDLVRAAERYDSHFMTQLTARGSELELQLLCLDPAPFVDASLSTGRSAALFSATLTPPTYYRSVLGCADARAVALESPFPAGNLGLFCLPGISTRYRDRERSVQSVSDALARLAQSRVGNYLAFFPSYAYLRQVQEDFAARYPGISTLVQESGLDDAARAAFLARFEPDPAHTLLGFAVMGGIFGEGVDLAGNRLIGCAIVGVGLPQVNPRQEMLRRYYDAQNGAGFDYAYRYPGMNKVLQAAGRVIRTPEDKGVVLLLDDRFAKPEYQRLFPLHWKHLQYLPGPAALETALAKHTAGQVAAQSAVTVDVYGFRGIQFSHPIPQLIYGNVDSVRTDEALDGHFLGSAHIQQSDRAILWNGLHVRPVELGNGSIPEVLNDISSHIDRIFGRGIGRGIGEIELS